MAKFILDDYTFDWNPDKYTPPESKKSVAKVDTINGAEVFQWEALVIGQEMSLEWNLMSEEQFQILRSKYVMTDILSFNPGEGIVYGVIISDINGDLIETSLYDLPYRENVELKMIIRSIA